MTSEQPDLRTAAVRGVRWTTGARITSEVLALGVLVLLARLVPPEAFGYYVIAVIAGELAILITSEGVGTSLVQRQEVNRAHLQAGLALSLLAGFALAGLALVAAGGIVEPIFGQEAAELVRISTPGFVVAAAGTVPLAILRRRLAFGRLSAIEVANTLGRALGALALAIAGLDGEALVLGGMVGGLAAVTIGWASAPAPPPRLRRGPVRDILGYGVPASLASISWVGFRNCDYAIVAARLGAVQAGLYFRAYTLAVDYQKKLSFLTGQVGFPVLARARATGEMEELRGHMVRLLTVAIFPLLALLAILAPVLVPWLFGERWAAAAGPTQILAVGGAATLVIDMVGVTLMATGRPRALLGYGWAHFLCYAGAVLLVAPLGLAAVAGAAAVVHALFGGVAYALMLRAGLARTLSVLWHDVAPATVSCLGLAVVAAPVGAALSSAGADALLHLCVVAAVGFLAYAVTLREVFPAMWRQVCSLIARVVRWDRIRGATRRAVAAGARSGA